MTCASPTRSRMAAVWVSMKEAIDQSPWQRQMAWQKLRRRRAPWSEWTTSGWNWMPKRSSRKATAAYSVLSVTARVRIPAGVERTLSPWLIHMTERSGMPSKSGEAGSVTRTSARPYSRAVPGPTRPPRVCAMSCIP